MSMSAGLAVVLSHQNHKHIHQIATLVFKNVM